MELKHLRYFKVLAEELNFRKAAARLNISQPPLSQQIKELEESLGIPLFHRLKQGNELTEAGKLLYQYTLEIFEKVEEAEEFGRFGGWRHRAHDRPADRLRSAHDHRQDDAQAPELQFGGREKRGHQKTAPDEQAGE